MAVPSYTTDLTSGEIDLGEVGGKTWAEPTAVGWTSGAGPSDDDDNPFQGAGAKSKAFNATGVGGMLVNNTAGVTIPTNGAFTGWFFWAPPAALESDANGGIRFMCGTDLANFLSWDVGGATSYAYGGWVNFAVNTTLTPDDTVGTGLGNSQYFGAAVNCINSIFKGSPFLCDAFRYGRCEARINGGENVGTPNYATFAGFAAVNDATSARWGLFQAIAGGYLFKGLMVLGYTSAVDFRDSNKNILIQNTNKVTSNFNTIEVRQATSRVDWTGIQITSLGTVAPGVLTVTDDADVNFTNCTFNDMGAHTYKSQTTLINTTFRRCGLVTQGSAVITNCRFEDATGAVALLSNNPAAITGSTFVSDGTGHAMEISVAGEYSLTGCTFTNYAPTGTPGTSGNEVIYNNSSGNVIINASACVGTITYKDGASATTTVNQTITLTLTGLVTGSDIVILDVGTTTERVNVDSNVGTTYAYGYADSGSSIDVGVFKAGYVPFYIRAYTLAATAASLPCAQVLDRNYLE